MYNVRKLHTCMWNMSGTENSSWSAVDVRGLRRCPLLFLMEWLSLFVLYSWMSVFWDYVYANMHIYLYCMTISKCVCVEGCPNVGMYLYKYVYGWVYKDMVYIDEGNVNSYLPAVEYMYTLVYENVYISVVCLKYGSLEMQGNMVGMKRIGTRNVILIVRKRYKFTIIPRLGPNQKGN